MARIEPIMLDSTGSSMNEELRLLNINEEKKNFLLQLISDSMLEGDGVVDCQSLTLSKSSIYNDKDESETLVATKTPENTTKPPRFYSTDPHIATVDDDGKVDLIKDGECKIHAVCGQKRATCNVKVETLNKADTVKINEGDQHITYVHPTAQLTALTTPTSYIRGVTWSSDDTDVATVSSAGNVTFASSGTANITATTLNGKTSSIKVTTEMGIYEQAKVNVQASLNKNSSTNKYRIAFGIGQSRCAFLPNALFIPVKAGQVITFSGYQRADMSVNVVKSNVEISSLTMWKSSISKNVYPFVKNGVCYAYPDFIEANLGTGEYTLDIIYTGSYSTSTQEEKSYTVAEDGYAIVTYKFIATTDMSKVDGDYIKNNTKFEISNSNLL